MNKPPAVPQWQPVSESDLQLQQYAKKLMALREELDRRCASTCDRPPRAAGRVFAAGRYNGDHPCALRNPRCPWKMPPEVQLAVDLIELQTNHRPRAHPGRHSPSFAGIMSAKSSRKVREA